jgi:hypothetical protein
MIELIDGLSADLESYPLGKQDRFHQPCRYRLPTGLSDSPTGACRSPLDVRRRGEGRPS